jgi:KUP system potassium uptake protein
MTFWTWAKGLEDAFDASNRANLRRFIVARGDAKSSAVDLRIPRRATADAAMDDVVLEENGSIAHSEEKAGTGYGYVAADEELHELVRIPTCAVFYKLSAGTGVPHSFVGFVRQWPALPRVVVRSFCDINARRR